MFETPKQENEKENNKEKTEPLELGRTVATRGALEALKDAEVSPEWYLAKHQSGDWGDLSKEDIAENELSLREGFRILSAYELPKTGVKIWIITEADRSSTTFLLPDEY